MVFGAREIILGIDYEEVLASVFHEHLQEWQLLLIGKQWTVKIPQKLSFISIKLFASLSLLLKLVLFLSEVDALLENLNDACPSPKTASLIKESKEVELPAYDLLWLDQPQHLSQYLDRALAS